MTIANTSARNDYVGNNATSTYAFTFLIRSASELLVTRTDTSGNEVPLALTTDYTVTGVGLAAGGTITLVAGNLATGYGLTIRLARALTQTRDIRNQGSFFPATIEDALDDLTRNDIQQQELIDRSVKLPEGILPSAFNPTLPPTIGQADATLAIDSVNKVLSLGPSAATVAGNVSAAAASAAASAGSATSSAGSAAASATSAASSAGSATAAAASATTAAGFASYQNPGAGSVLRTVQGWIGDQVISVKDFGARGDGVTDDTAAVNAAITYANSLGGATVFFPRSTAGYLVSSTITIPNNVALKGTTRDNTVVKAKAGFTGSFVLSSTAINVSILDLIVHCNSVGNLSGISLSSTGALQGAVARVKVIGLAKASPWNNIGIYVKGFNAAVSDIEIDGGVIYGVQFNGASDVFISNILCVNSDIGMALYGCEQVTVDSVQMDSCNTTYMQIDTSHDISVNGFHAFFNASVYSTSNNQVGILIGTVGSTYSAPNVNSDIQLSNVVLRNFGQGSAADIGIQLVACENLVLANVSIANSANTFFAGGTIGVGLKYSQGSNTLSGVISNLNIRGVATLRSGSAPASNWTVLIDTLPLAGGTMTGPIAMGTSKVTGVGDPTASQDAATKNYVDTVASSMQPILAVYAASTANIPGTYANGTAGVGATFTVTATGAFSIDGVSPPANSRILLKDQTDGTQNGVYTLTTAGTTGVSPILTRAADWNTPASINAGDLIPVTHGTANITTAWLQTATVNTIGTDAPVFVQWSATPSSYLRTSLLTTKGDLLGFSTSAARVAVGSDGSVLTADSTQTTGLKWNTPLTNPMTALGDLISGGASGAATRLAGDTSNARKFLRSQSSGGTSSAPVWDTHIAGDVPYIPPFAGAILSGGVTWNRPYTFVIASGNATAGATYTSNGVTYTVLATVASSTQVVMSGSGAPSASGTLTKASGVGDATLTFSQAVAPLYLRVETVGAGGGGGPSGSAAGTAGTAGTSTTTFGAFVTCNPGSGGAGGNANGGAGGAAAALGTGAYGQTLPGGAGQGGSNTVATGQYAFGGMGGANALGGAGSGGAGNSTGGTGAANTGAGGGGGGASSTGAGGGAGGGSGSYVDCVIPNPPATVATTVGGGGTGGSGGGTATGGNGANGGIWWWAYFQ